MVLMKNLPTYGLTRLIPPAFPAGAKKRGRFPGPFLNAWISVELWGYIMLAGLDFPTHHFNVRFIQVTVNAVRNDYA